MGVDSFIQQMTSDEGILYRGFFECGECGFVFTVMGQANYDIDGGCSACGEHDIDYACKESRVRFLKGLMEELDVFEELISKQLKS